MRNQEFPLKEKREKILIADDDPDVSQLLFYLLEDDYEVFKTFNGKETIETVKKNKPELIILDYMMPDMTGLDVIEKIKGNYEDSFVIIITGQGNEKIAVKLMKAGAIDYIVKPFTNQKILEVVKNTLYFRKITLKNRHLTNELLKSNKQLQKTTSSLEISNHNLEIKLNELAELQKFSTEINHVVEIELLLDQLLSSLKVHFSLESGIIALFDNEDASAIHTTSSIGSLANGINISTILKQANIQKALKIPEIKVVTSINKNDFKLINPAATASLTLPLISSGRLIGVYYGETTHDEIIEMKNSDLFKTISNQLAIAVRNAQLFEQLSKSYLDTTFALATAVETKDQVTGGHIERVTRYAIQIGLALNLEDEDIKTLQFGATLHDIGKIGIRDEILCKPGRLTDTEMEIIKEHPIIGDTIIANIEFLEPVRPIVRHHHERWDGNGYPDGLRGKAIPLFARIISIVDVFDVVTHDRPYRRALTWDDAVDELKANAGTQFDPSLIKLFVDNLDTFPLMPKKTDRKIRSFS